MMDHGGKPWIRQGLKKVKKDKLPSQDIEQCFKIAAKKAELKKKERDLRLAQEEIEQMKAKSPNNVRKRKRKDKPEPKKKQKKNEEKAEEPKKKGGLYKYFKLKN